MAAAIYEEDNMGKSRGGYTKTKKKKPPVTKTPVVNPAHNKNCEKCRFSNKKSVWASEGTCNFIGITGKARSLYYKAKDCPGFPGKREHKATRHLAISLPRKIKAGKVHKVRKEPEQRID